MESDDSGLHRNAVGIAILTVGGMMAGFLFGVVRSSIARNDPFEQLGTVVSSGFVGTILGLGLAIVLAVMDRGSFRSIKKTMTVVAVSAVVLWAIVTLVRELVVRR